MNICIPSSSSLKLKASIVKINFTINFSGQSIDETLFKVNRVKNMLNDLVVDRKSYVKGSYKQSTLDISKKYSATNITDNYYEISVYCSCVLNIKNKKTAIEDFIDLYNFSNVNNIKFDYEFDITNEERKQAVIDLTAQIIDKGMNQIRSIIEKSTELAGTKPFLNKIEEPELRAKISNIVPDFTKHEATFDSDFIITPDLVADMFENTNIHMHSTLNLNIDLRSSKTLN